MLGFVDYIIVETAGSVTHFNFPNPCTKMRHDKLITVLKYQLNFCLKNANERLIILDKCGAK